MAHITGYNDASDSAWHDTLKAACNAWREPEKCWKALILSHEDMVRRHCSGKRSLFSGMELDLESARESFEIPEDAKIMYRITVPCAAMVFVIAYPTWPNINDELVLTGTIGNHELAFGFLERIKERS